LAVIQTLHIVAGGHRLLRHRARHRGDDARIAEVDPGRAQFGVRRLDLVLARRDLGARRRDLLGLGFGGLDRGLQLGDGGAGLRLGLIQLLLGDGGGVGALQAEVAVEVARGVIGLGPGGGDVGQGLLVRGLGHADLDLGVIHLALGLGPLGLGVRHLGLGVGGIDGHQLLAGADPLVVVDQHLGHQALDLRRQPHDLHIDEGVVGGLEVARVQPEQQAADQQDSQRDDPGHDDHGVLQRARLVVLAVAVLGRRVLLSVPGRLVASRRIVVRRPSRHAGLQKTMDRRERQRGLLAEGTPKLCASSAPSVRKNGRLRGQACNILTRFSNCSGRGFGA
jgi:hypothetical protein